ncbi:hypothetical protein LQE92_04475 [Lacrimispora sp. NSJ-141]|uniref:Uncharacterized protein n=1 Tax=Lientehia hominis TaxID=2897778 RepID=A0AAP2RH52_9FIRM|nr:hypothetical protein [Lientehia hominis]MCD2491881.1 hypothetical protein [Lientehia hominis]
MNQYRQDCPCKRRKCAYHGDCAACRTKHETAKKRRPMACERLTAEEDRKSRKKQEDFLDFLDCKPGL